ncbi:MAG: MBL fold metallo-hydrolase [Gemmatimonadaceae bacterium]
MRLTTIGTGMAAPHPTRVQAGHLVDVGDVHLLMDCGSGVTHRLAALGLPWSEITHIALTHFDADHVSDLASLFIGWRWGQHPPRSAPVELVGPPGTSAFLDRVAAALWPSLRAPGFAVTVREVSSGEELDLSGARLAARKVPHTAESVAYSITAADRRIVYTGDTGYDATLGEWAADCDVLLAECSLPAALATGTHLTPEECGALAAVAAPGRLALTHFYPPVERVDIRALVAERYTGPVTLAFDGWSLELEDK